MSWTIPAGIALVLLLLGDVFFTVLHPQAHGGPINRLLMRSIWPFFLAVAGVLRPAARDRWLSMAGPALAAAMLIAWAALLVTGFALVYGAFPTAFLHTQWQNGIGWGEAFYFSGVAASTLGMGDVLVEPGWLRALVVVEALLGFMLISISAAYLLAVFSAQGDASSLALEVWGAVGDDTDAGIERLLGDLDATDGWAGATARRLAHVTADHAQYPILHYFRPPDPRQAVLPQAGVLLRLFQRLEDRARWEEGHPSLVMLHNALGRYLVEISRRFARGSRVETGDEDDEPTRARRYRQALLHLGYRDVDVAAPHDRS